MLKPETLARRRKTNRMTFKGDCERYFGTSCLYSLLGVTKGTKCSNAQLKAAYYKAALRFHPDRCDSDDKEVATAKFQLISRAFAILNDDGKRDLYDRTGCLDDDEIYEDSNWFSEWSWTFKVVTLDSINAYMKSYQGSSEEIQDVKNAYVKYKGDMDEIMQAVPFAECDQEPRLRAIIDKLIEDKEVKPYKIFVSEPPSKAKKRLARWKRERAMAEKFFKSENGESTDSLVEVIKGRQAKRVNFLQQLEEKYAGKDKAGPSKDSSRQKSGKYIQFGEDAIEKQNVAKKKGTHGTASGERELDGEAAGKIHKRSQAREKSGDKKKVGKSKDDTSIVAKEGNIPGQSIPNKKVKKQEGKANDISERKSEIQLSRKKSERSKRKNSASERVEDGCDDEPKIPTIPTVRKRALRMKGTESNGEINTEKSSAGNAEESLKSAGGDAPSQSSVARNGKKKVMKTEQQSKSKKTAQKLASVMSAKDGEIGQVVLKVAKGRKREVKRSNGVKKGDSDHDLPGCSSTVPPSRNQQVVTGRGKKKGRKAGE